MQETLEGVVTELDGDFAKVRPKRHTACDDCQACNTANLIVLALNSKKAAVGQTVNYIQAENGMLTIAWVLFIQPMLAVFAGIGLGSLAASALRLPEAVTMTAGALVLFALAVVFVRWFDRRYKLRQSNFAKITAIVS
ncbi:MAG TPA: SoxR reducing system RseC family protein [Spirochaetia bacterium]|nr:SoxR reducing system RseC family protein [Spirochaetia bacterium]